MSRVKNVWYRATAAATAAALLLGGTGSSLLAAVTESPIQIAHDPLACVVTDFAPKIDAGVAPGNIFDKGYVYFKAAGTDDFYYAPMAGQPALITGILPRPLPETKAIDYYVRATDVQDLAKKTSDYVPPVVPGNACKTKGVAVGKDGANLTIGLTRAGQDPAPKGFNRRDIAFVILFGGATVTLAEALRQAGTASASTSTSSVPKKSGGLSTGAAVGIGAVVVGAGALAIANNNRGNRSSTATPTPTPNPTPTPTTAFQFIEADATWSGIGNVDVEIRDPGNNVVGTNLPAGCESVASRTERVLLQGVLAPGTYRVMLKGSDCPPGGGAPASIATALTVVQSGSSPKCVNTFVNVPLGTSIQGCQFTIP